MLEPTKPPTRELQEFWEVCLSSKEGFDFIEKLNGRKGLLPPLPDDSVKKAELLEILKPRPFVRPIVKRRARLATPSKTYDNILDGARSLPTPPYEPDPGPCPVLELESPRPDVSSAVQPDPQSVPSPAVDVSHLCEDLDGIADVAQGSPPPAALPPLHSPPPSKRQPKPGPRNSTARKSTKTLHRDRIKKCSVSLVDLRMTLADRDRLVKEYFAHIKCNARTNSRTDSVDSGHATDEGERVVPPLKIRIPPPKRKQAVQYPSSSRAASAQDLLHSVIPSVSPKKRMRITPDHKRLEPGPLSADRPGVAVHIRDSGLKAPIKGILKNNSRIRSDAMRNGFLTAFSSEKAESLVSLPKDVIQTHEFNCTSQRIFRLDIFTPKCHKEVADLGEIPPYPVVCIQCNATFPSKRELSAHALASNHSSVFSY